MTLPHAWAESEPAIVASLQRLARADLEGVMSGLNPTWRIYIGHVVECPRCAHHNALELDAALVDLRLLN